MTIDCPICDVQIDVPVTIASPILRSVDGPNRVEVTADPTPFRAHLRTHYPDDDA